MKILWAVLCALTMLTACAPAPPDQGSPVSPLVIGAGDTSRAKHIVIFVPGAFASTEIFAPAQDWADADTALVYYRFPGLDGLALDHRLNIERAASEIAVFANAHPQAHISMVGYSTGGPIVLEASQRITNRTRLSIAMISPAADFGGGAETALRSTMGVIRAAERAGTLDVEAIWQVYWQSLLYGLPSLDDPDLAPRIARLTEDHEPDIIIPLYPIFVSHTQNLRQWSLPNDIDLSGISVRIFIGLDDAVFSTAQTQALAYEAGIDDIWAYPLDDHLVVLTRSTLFPDIRDFLFDR